MSQNVALDTFINSATSDPAYTPHPEKPVPPALSVPYYKAWRWQWRLSLDNLVWTDPGTLILRLDPASPPSMLTVNVWDAAPNWNGGLGNGQTGAASNVYIDFMTAVFNVANGVAGQPPFLPPCTPYLNYPLNADKPSAYYVVLVGGADAFPQTADTTHSKTAQKMPLTSVSLGFNPAFFPAAGSPAASIDVAVYISAINVTNGSMTNKTFIKDPEMVGDVST